MTILTLAIAPAWSLFISFLDRVLPARSGQAVGKLLEKPHAPKVNVPWPGIKQDQAPLAAMKTEVS